MTSRLFIVSILFVVACNPYSPDLGDEPFQCANDGTCPDGYSCEGDPATDGVCVATEPTPDIDAPDDNFQCANDSSIEPNNDPTSAFVTPIPSQVNYSLVGLAICPVGDRDHYRFNISTNGTDFEATVTGVANRPSLSIQVLNSTGTMIATGAPVSGMPQVVKVEMPSGLAIGTYHVLVQSPDNTENNYDLVMKICATLPCP
jgi:hypothetical protein